MKDVVEKILKEEEKASKAIQDAKIEAERIVKDAKKNKESIIGKAISEAEDSSHKQKQDSEKRFISEKESVLEGARKEASAIRDKKTRDVSEVSRRVFSQIITIK